MKMRKNMVIAITAALILATALADLCLAEKKTETITGTVTVVKDEDNNITDVTLSTDDAVYTIALDAKGKKLGEAMDGKKVEAKGTVEETDDGKVLTVTEYKEVKEEAAPEGDAEEDAE
ncbi:hypothetical protein ACFL01_03540 [Planctomycetota bacterium]